MKMLFLWQSKTFLVKNMESLQSDSNSPVDVKEVGFGVTVVEGETSLLGPTEVASCKKEKITDIYLS